MKNINNIFNILKFITSHPVTVDNPVGALRRFLQWQIKSRFYEEIIFDWIGESKLVVRKGMTGATGNIYCGLHEFADMAFVIHLLQEHDTFIDVGANIGSYTVLASKICGARSVSVEPDPGTILALYNNIVTNFIQDRVTIVEAALGNTNGSARFTIGRDTTNRIARHDDLETREICVKTLDSVVCDLNPTCIKLDVEGFESQVLKGGRETLYKQSLLAILTESDAPQVADILIKAGFHKFFYDPIQRKLEKHVVFESNNSLYVRNRENIEERIRQAPRRIVFDKLI